MRVQSEADATDDPEIPGQEILYRRVTSEQVREQRANSNAFQDSTRDGTPCSVALGSKLAEYGLTYLQLLNGYEDAYGVIEFPAQAVRDAGLGVAYTPRFPREPAHGSLVGKKTQGARKKLAKATKVIVPPPTERHPTGTQERPRR